MLTFQCGVGPRLQFRPKLCYVLGPYSVLVMLKDKLLYPPPQKKKHFFDFHIFFCHFSKLEKWHLNRLVEVYFKLGAPSFDSRRRRK